MINKVIIIFIKIIVWLDIWLFIVCVNNKIKKIVVKLKIKLVKGNKNVFKIEVVILVIMINAVFKDVFVDMFKVYEEVKGLFKSDCIIVLFIVKFVFMR